ncbi:hypothetical protein NE865_11991 [Phthorimaea operculella]|nr:hypothetical protein NE865_11991 [Phthorimaea operculella]
MNLFPKTVICCLLSITAPIFCLYEDQRKGIETDVNGRQEEKYDDSLISSHNFRKQQGDILKGWRRSGNFDIHQYPQHRMSLKSQMMILRRNANVPKPKTDKEEQSNKANEVIDVKFRMDKPKRRVNYDNTDFAYHDKMKDEGAGTVDEFERNLKLFEEMGQQAKLDNAVSYLHGNDLISSRRSGNVQHGDSEKEILFHHAVPIDVKINGFLQVPLEE